jgi:hypothetical protein
MMGAERMLRAATQEARKKDTREKIQLGGLIVKAGLRFEKRAVLLGLLLDAKDRLRQPAERQRLFELGARGLNNASEAAGAPASTSDDADAGGPAAAD